MLEELKAQTGASYLLPFVVSHDIIPADLLKDRYTASVFWCLNLTASSNVFSGSGAPSPYSQVAAIQLNVLREDGALIKKNTPDGWRFEINYDKVPKSFERIIKEVGQIQSKETVAEALETAKNFVGKYVGLTPQAPGPAFDPKLMQEIRAKYTTVPKESFSFNVKY